MKQSLRLRNMHFVVICWWFITQAFIFFTISDDSLVPKLVYLIPIIVSDVFYLRFLLVAPDTIGNLFYRELKLQFYTSSFLISCVFYLLKSIQVNDDFGEKPLPQSLNILFIMRAYLEFLTYLIKHYIKVYRLIIPVNPILLFIHLIQNVRDSAFRYLAELYLNLD